jgi:hypothetical protein
VNIDLPHLSDGCVIGCLTLLTILLVLFIALLDEWHEDRNTNHN